MRRRFGLEAAQVALGHSQARVTELYAERDLTLAVRVAEQMGRGWAHCEGGVDRQPLPPLPRRNVHGRSAPDDRARLVDEMPAKVAKQLLAGLSPRERVLTATLLGYPENSAGRVMSPEVVNLKANQTAGDALARLRRVGATVQSYLFDA